MKATIAYALVILGVTQMLGMLVGGLISVPIAMITPHDLKLRVQQTLEFFHGAAALAAALTLFWLLSVSITVALPMIVGAWLTFYFFSYGQSKIAWIATVVGILTCWTVYRITMAP